MIERHAAGFMLDVAGIPRLGCDDDNTVVIVEFVDLVMDLIPQVLDIHFNELDLAPIPSRFGKGAGSNIVGVWISER